MSSSLDIIIVNWNSGQQLQRCVDSITKVKEDVFKINRLVVVDNASVDGSVGWLDAKRMDLNIIRNKANYGFAKGCNMGAKGSKADYLLFLNPDIRLFQNSLGNAVSFMEENKNQQIGIVGIQLIGENGKISPSCSHFPTLLRFFFKMLGLDRLFPSLFPRHFMGEWDHKESKVVDQVMGAFFLVCRQLFENIGGFDEQFFVYFEDVDFSLRAKQAGWKSFYLTNAQAYHRGQGTSEQVKGHRLFYSLNSRILYGYKHFDWWSGTTLLITTLFLEPLARFIFGIVQCSSNIIRETFEAYLLLWKNLPQLIKITYQKNRL